MKKEIKSEIVINASPQMVWEQLTDFASYKDWNPFIVYLTGPVDPGSRIKVGIHPLDSKRMDFTPTILKAETAKELRWRGVLWLKGIFDGEHYFRLADNEDGTTTLVQGEIFSGILVPFFTKMISIKTLGGFELMNRKLKEKVEGMF